MTWSEVPQSKDEMLYRAQYALDHNSRDALSMAMSGMFDFNVMKDINSVISDAIDYLNENEVNVYED